jgi:peroxiredoxin
MSVAGRPEQDAAAADGKAAAARLSGAPIPGLLLDSTQGPVDLAELAAGRLVLYIYPRTGVPSEAPLPGWDTIPGARGCTAQSCAFRDHHRELTGLGADVAGLSVQPLVEQRAFASCNDIPFRLISDPERALGTALSLPTFAIAGRTFYRRLTLVAELGQIEKVFYPVDSPERNATEVLAWLAQHTAATEASE